MFHNETNFLANAPMRADYMATHLRAITGDFVGEIINLPSKTKLTFHQIKVTCRTMRGVEGVAPYESVGHPSSSRCFFILQTLPRALTSRLLPKQCPTVSLPSPRGSPKRTQSSFGGSRRGGGLPQGKTEGVPHKGKLTFYCIKITFIMGGQSGTPVPTSLWVILRPRADFLFCRHSHTR